VTDWVALWLGYAHRTKMSAVVQDGTGDAFGARLCLARAEVRTQAAALLAASATPAAAAAEMHRRAAALWQSELPLVPLVEFDEAAIAYTQARIWQDCAQSIEPGLPQVQPKLDRASQSGPPVTVRKGKQRS
jgi:hypothetical protein